MKCLRWDCLPELFHICLMLSGFHSGPPSRIFFVYFFRIFCNHFPHIGDHLLEGHFWTVPNFFKVHLEFHSNRMENICDEFQFQDCLYYTLFYILSIFPGMFLCLTETVKVLMSRSILRHLIRVFLVRKKYLLRPRLS